MDFAQVLRARCRALRCDGACGRRLPAGVWTYGCEACDADVCMACADDPESVGAVKRGARGSKRPPGEERAEPRGKAPCGPHAEPRAGDSGQGGEASGVLRRKAKRKRHCDPGREPGPAWGEEE